jgi:multidrug efflux pump subunit AcrB
MNFVTWSIRNPIPVVVLFALLTLGGLLSFSKLGVQDMPDIEFPVVTVTVAYPGVPPSQLETEVTRKVEDAVANVLGVRRITSNVSEGASTTAVELQFEANISDAMDSVRDAVARIRSDLPADARDPIVSRVTTAGLPVVTFSVSSPTMSDTELSWFVDNTVIRNLSAVSGVGRVNRVGGVAREIRVDLDPDRMAALGATASDVSQQLRRIQAEFPGGEARVGGLSQSVRTTGRIASAAELADLPIALPDGRSVRLETIAEVRDTAAERTQLAVHNGQPVIGFEVVRAWGSGALQVADSARTAIDEMAKLYPNLKFQEVNSTVEHIRQSYHSSIEMLFEGAILAVLVVWLFLRDWRATIVSATALPLAIIPTFWAMDLLGYTLNTLTLLALSLVVGMLVDDAIVEVENIVRHLQGGKKPLEAAKDAAIEIGLAVVATTLTLVAVFVPVAFMDGVPGKFFRPFAFTAAVAVVFSLVVARMLTPMMAAYILKPHGAEDPPPGRIKLWYLARMEWCLHHRAKTLGIATVALVACFATVPFIPKGFSPAEDQGFVALGVELPPGTTIDDTAAVCAAINDRIAPLEGVESIAYIVGTGSEVRFGVNSTSQVRKAQFKITLLPLEDREVSQAQVERAITAATNDVPGVRLSFQSQRGNGQIQLTLASDDAQLLEKAADSIQREMRDLPGFSNITSSASLVQPELVVQPNPERAAALGVTTDALALVTRIATSGDVDTGLAKLNLSSRQIPIRVRLNDAARADIETLRMLPVPARQGMMVPLMNVADVSLAAGPAQISRFDRSRDITITASLDGPLGEAWEKLQALPSVKQLPPGVRQLPTGNVEFMVELFAGFAKAMIIGILCVYALMVLLFREFLQPVTILSALPPSVGGALLFLCIFRFDLSISSLIGMLMLMGIVAKNSILLVEYALKAMEERGLSRNEALIDACAKRVRPIVMTTIAMGAGMLPIAMGWSGDSSFRAPMGVTVIGGLLASTALSLFVVPVIFTLVDGARRRLQQWTGKRKDEATPTPATATPGA